MDILKKFWPTAFKSTEKNDFITAIVVYAVILVVGIISGKVLGLIPPAFLGSLLAWLVGTVFDLYGTAGIVFSILKFVKVFKD